jgi:ABC-2 type transport system ATP-binding protein
LILDEPTGGIDEMSKKKLWRLIQEQKQKSIVIMTSHDLDEVEAIGDRLVIVDQGKIKF